MTRLTARRLLVVALASALAMSLFVPSAAVAERTIALNTGTFSISLPPGKSASDTVMVANNGDEKLQALVYTADVKVNEQGEPDYIRPESSPANYLSSPASWIRLKVPDSTKIVANTPYLEMDPGMEFPVAFEIVVPQNATPGDYNAVIFFEMFDFAEGDTGAVSRVSGRIGARIDLRVVGDISDKLEVGPMSARTFVIGDTTPFSTKVRNEGNIDKRYSARLELVGSGNEVKWSKVLEDEANVYAMNNRAYDGTVKFTGVGLGKYTFRTVVEYQREVGDDAGTMMQDEKVVSRTLWVIPLWVLIAALLVIGLPALYITYRLSTRGERTPHSRSERRSKRGGHADTATDVRPDPNEYYDPDSAEDSPRRATSAGGSTRGTGLVEGAPTEELWAPDSVFEDDGPGR